jgi:hypothetical protein
VNSRFKAAHRPQVERQKVKEKRSLGFGGKRNHLAFLRFGRGLVNVLEVGGFPPKARAIVDDLAIDLAGCKIDKTQPNPQSSRAKGRFSARATQIDSQIIASLYITTTYEVRRYYWEPT